MKKIDLSALGQFDGGCIAAALDREVAYAVADCRDRPAEDKVRKVLLQIELIPQPDPSTGDVDAVEMKFQVKSTIPTRKSRKYSVGVKPNNTLYYNSDSPDNVNQGTLLPEDDEPSQDSE